MLYGSRAGMPCLYCTGITIAEATCHYYLNEMETVQRTKIDLKKESRVIFPAGQLDTVYEHCRRKLSENYLANESRERKAFGLIAGYQSDLDLTVVQCLPLMKNARQAEPYKKFMDRVMVQHAVPSETPFSKRGWVADPEELMKKTKALHKKNLLLFGIYHMHRVAWPDDPLRDTPTTLDTVLGDNSKMLIFIISLVKSEKPRIRAFYEGKPDREIPIVVKDIANKSC
jgi:hypothetical protein